MGRQFRRRIPVSGSMGAYGVRNGCLRHPQRKNPITSGTNTTVPQLIPQELNFAFCEMQVAFELIVSGSRIGQSRVGRRWRRRCGHIIHRVKANWCLSFSKSRKLLLSAPGRQPSQLRTSGEGGGGTTSLADHQSHSARKGMDRPWKVMYGISFFLEENPFGYVT